MLFEMLVIYTLISMAVIMDHMYFKISNQLNLCGLVMAIAFCLIFRLDQSKLKLVWGFLLPIAMLYPVYAIGGIGAGDVKLLSVLGGIMGADCILRFIAICFAVAAIIGIIKILYLVASSLIGKEKFRVGLNRIHFSYAIFAAGFIGPVANNIFRFSEGGFC